MQLSVRPIYVREEGRRRRVGGLHEVKKGELFTMHGAADDPFLKGTDVCRALEDGYKEDNGSGSIKCEVVESGIWTS